MEEDALPVVAPRPLVMFAGALTTVLTVSVIAFFDAYALQSTYLLYLPVGAFITGTMAASGYGLASWKLMDQTMPRLMLLTIALSMVGLYLTIELLSYWEHASASTGFFEYFETATREGVLPERWLRRYEPRTGGLGNRGLELVTVILGGVAGCGIVPISKAYLSLGERRP